jgi:hypothetical protein
VENSGSPRRYQVRVSLCSSPCVVKNARSTAQSQLIPALAKVFSGAQPSSLFLKPQEGTNAMLFLKLCLSAPAEHDSRFGAPAGFVMQSNNVDLSAVLWGIHQWLRLSIVAATVPLTAASMGDGVRMESI